MERAAKYKRISDDKEGRELGVTRQDEDIDQLASRRDIEVVAEYTDNDISASTSSTKPRPEYNRMIRDAKAGLFGVIICYSSSRLTRRPRENEDLIDLARNHGIRFVYVRSPEWDLNTADGREYARMAAARDAGEAERTSERVARAARQRAEKGEWHGGVLVFGLRRSAQGSGKVIEPDPVASPLVREAASRVLRGESLYAVCQDWNARGITTTRGNRWRAACLRKVLVSPSLVGMREHGGKLHRAPWPAVLDRDVWNRLRDLVGERKKGSVPAVGVGNRYEGKRALSGIAHCSCGAKLIGRVQGPVSQLLCHEQATSGCGKVLIRYEPLEQFVIDMLMARLDSPSFRAALRSRSTTTNQPETALRDELALVERRRLGVADGLEIGAYTKAEAATRVRQLDEERTRIQAELTRLAGEHVLDGVESTDDARELLASADVTRRRRFLQTFIADVVVKPFPRGVGLPLSLRRRNNEAEEDWCSRRLDHERAVLRERVAITWVR